VLTRAHEREFGKVSETNRPIWVLAEERQESKEKSGEKAYSAEFAAWNKTAKFDW